MRTLAGHTVASPARRPMAGWRGFCARRTPRHGLTAHLLPARLAGLFLALLVGWTAGAGAAPPAGTLITNQATANHVDPGSGAALVANSNAVTVTVLGVEAVTLVADEFLNLVPGVTATFVHTLTNTGNVDTTFTLDAVNLPGDDFDLTNLAIVVDVDGSGSVDAGEPVLASGDALVVIAGQALQLLLMGDVPGSPGVGQVGRLQLSATGSAPAVTASVTDTVTIVGAALLSVTKSASNPTPNPGDPVTFTLSATNVGLGAAAGVPITVDAAPASFVVLHDPLPADTSFLSIVSTGGGTVLYHTAGAPVDSYVTTAPAPASVDEIAFGFPALGPGTSVSAQFQVRIAASPSGPTISNGAEARYDDGVAPGVTRSASNVVVLTLPTTPATISFYQDAGFATLAFASSVGAPLYVQAVAGSCNLDPGVAETIPVQVVSRLAGDTESFSAVETGPSTGIFRILPQVPTADAALVPVASGNGVLEVLVDDEVAASLVDCGSSVTVETRILIDPQGVVFDSQTNQPVAGATVRLIDETGAGNGNPGGLATVFQADGTTPAPASVVTGPTGRYEFPLVPASTYRLEVTAPSGFQFPSAIPPSGQPAGRVVVAGGSYGTGFAVTASLGPVQLDLPLDPLGSTGGVLFVEKEPSREAVEIGDFLDYTLRVRNAGTAALVGVVLEDVLPRGFRYERSSARLGGRRIGDPLGDAGPELRFRLGTIAAGETARLQYRVLVGPGAANGDGVNVAQARSAALPGVASNVARARVRVVEGVFSERAFILGKVFVDRDADGMQGAAEPGIPGVTLWLEDGTYTVTDEDGAYSFYGVRPRTHVLKVDRTSLPPGSRLVALSQRNALDAGSRFVDLKAGELHRADFAEGSASEEVLAAVSERRRRLREEAGEIEVLAASELRVEEPILYETNLRGRAAAGVVDRAGTSRAGPRPTPEPRSKPASDASTQRARQERERSALAEELLEHGPEAEILEPYDGAILGSGSATVRVKGTAGTTLALEVNGQPVAESQVGKRVVLPDRKLQVWEYVAVALEPGRNELALREVDPFGNERDEHAIHVMTPGELRAVRLELPAEDPIADPTQKVWIAVLVEDALGIPVRAPTPVTLETPLGGFEAEDLDEVEPGLQILVTGGRGVVLLEPPSQPGEVRIRATAGPFQTTRTLSFVPHLRPLLGVGLLEGRVALRDFNGSGSRPERALDGFEDALREVSRDFDGDEGSAELRGAAFVKGRIRGDALLTFRYDTEKDPDERLFRDIEPDQFYPIYGDSSVRGYDAQSTSRLYLRVDKDKSWLLHGDFTTQAADDAIELGGYQRSLSGFRGHLEHGAFSLDAFASESDTRQVVREIRGRGISGPYRLGDRDLRRGSETVEILTRDRNQPSLVLASRTLSRFTDYELDPIEGVLLLRNPVPSLDAGLNPVVIRVSYELEGDGREFWVAGATGQVRPTEGLVFGASYVGDRDPAEPLELLSGHGRWELNDRTTLVGEYARATSAGARGDGLRLDLRHEGERLDAWAYWARTDPEFRNPSSRFSQGRSEAGLRSSFRLFDRTRIQADLLQTEDERNGGRRRGAELAVEQGLTDWLTGELGVRHMRETAAPADPNTATPPGITPFRATTARARLTSQVPWVPTLSVFGEYEQDLSESERKVLAAGGEVQVAPRTRLYARHEFLSSLESRFALNTEQERRATVFGIQSDYLQDTDAFSEYRIRNAIAGRDAEAAVGLRNRWALRKGLALHTSLEKVQTLTGDASGDATALALALSYTADPTWKGTGRIEYRDGEVQDTLLSTLAAAARLDERWSVLGRTLIEVADRPVDVGDDFMGRLQLGLAYRPADSNRWNALGRYEYRFERDGDLGFRRRRGVHIVSLHGDWQISRRFWATGRYAAKWVGEDSLGLDSAALTQLVGGRLTFELAERWDLGLGLGALVGDGAASIEYQLGAEVGYLLAQNLWLSAGFNFAGFEDRDLRGQDYTEPGPYLRIRFKFDEEILRWLEGGER